MPHAERTPRASVASRTVGPPAADEKPKKKGMTPGALQEARELVWKHRNRLALGVLRYLTWRLTTVTIIILGAFGGGMAPAFKRLRPLFRERGQINAEVTGRLTESLGGVRIVKSYTAEKREELVFAKGAHRLFRNVAKSLTGVSAVTAFSSVVIGATGIAMMVIGGHAIRNGSMTLGS